MEWDNCNEQLAHINLPDDKIAFNWFAWDCYVKDNMNADGKVVLDYGCGGGVFYRWLASSYRIKKYIGLDISQRSLRECEKFIAKDDELFLLPKDGLKADIIVCFAVIQHMTKEQLRDFKEFVVDVNPKEVFCQIRVGDKYQEDNLIYRTWLNELELPGFYLVNESDIIPSNNYKYLKYENKNRRN